MNLAAYDKVGSITKVKSKRYSSNNYPYIVTREIKKRKYYCYVSRYDPASDNNVLYLVLLDDKPEDRQVCRTRMDDYGRLKFNLSPAAEIYDIKPNVKYDVSISVETQADDGDIYRVDISMI